MINTVINIREFHKNDSRAVKDLIQYVLSTEFPEAVKAYPDTDLKDIQTVYGGKRNKFFVALSNNDIVGTVAIKEDDDEVALLRRIFVHPKHRNKGCGTALLTKAIDFARNNNYSSLVFRSTNKMSLANLLCVKNGFTEIAQIDFEGVTILQFIYNL